jgi:hypothetical protein
VVKDGNGFKTGLVNDLAQVRSPLRTDFQIKY